MPYPMRAFAALSLVLMLCACSGNAYAPSTTTNPNVTDALPAAGDQAVAAAAQPAAYDPLGPDAERVQLPNDRLPPAGLNLDRLRNRRTPFSVAGANDHEDAGVGFDGTGRYTSLFAVHAVYPNLTLTYNPNETGSQLLYAPTSKTGCLENVTVYFNYGYGNLDEVAVWDWCNKIGFISGLPMDGRFTKLYVRRIAGVPSYVTEIYAHDLKPHKGTRWYALIYNFAAKRWNQLAQIAQQPAQPVYNGWSIFETYLMPGPCPAVPPVSAAAISLYDTHIRRWRLLSPSLPDLTTSTSSGPPGSCFVHGGGAGATYVLRTLLPDYYWRVVSVQ